MDRRASSSLLTGLLVLVAALLVQSALSIPGRVYTGIALYGNLVATVDPGSPGQRAGLLPGDRLVRPDAPASADALRDAAIGRPLTLWRLRGGERRAVWMAPEALPPRERRLIAALIVVASVFVMLGGWVWAERRDALTRPFFLLCLALGCLLPPPPYGLERWTSVVVDLVLTGVTLAVPALFVHFFSMFPEPRATARRGVMIRAGYVIAAVLFVLAIVSAVLEAVGSDAAAPLHQVLQLAAVGWFAAGMIVALVLFVVSYAREKTPDARRRLRVALAGTVLGLGPLTASIVVRGLSPGTALPGERWAVPITLLVPASFAWAIVVHRVLDVRVALRGAVAVLVVTAACAIAYALGEGWAEALGARAGIDLAGGAVALVALTASLAGPMSPWLRSLGMRLLPDDDEASLAAWLNEHTAAMPVLSMDSSLVVAEACVATARRLRLECALAIERTGDTVRVVTGSRVGPLPEPGPELGTRLMARARVGLQSVEEANLDREDRDALRHAGAMWLLGAGTPDVRALFVLGRRVAGSTWLSRRESLDLERFARQLGIGFEVADLRRAATSHGVLARELREAAVVQAHLLPQRVPVHPTLDCAATVLSTEPVGGDYFDFVERPDRSFTLAVGDVAGHGLPAALLLSHVQAQFRTLAERDGPPAEILATLNRELIALDQPQKFVGLLCARVDVRHGRVSIANAGLTPALVRRRNGQIETLESSGVLLGVQREARYVDQPVDLGRGDLLVVHTDGLTEAQRGQELFGLERLIERLTAQGDGRARDIVERLLEDVRAFADQPLDDLTVVAIRQLTQPAWGNGSTPRSPSARSGAGGREPPVPGRLRS